jgi:hypothetical protein
MNNLSVSQLKQAIQLKEQIEKLESQLSHILGGKTTSSAAAPATSGRKTLSAAVRARIGAAQKERWAKIKGKSPTAKAARKKRGGLSAAGRARIIAAQKARWQEAKKKARPVAISIDGPKPKKS